MCGIVGVLNLDDRRVEAGLLQRMVRTLWHRGPDDEGIYTDGAVGLAHRRLSIIDIAGGHQPMQLRDALLSITFNGEIFNFIELREMLEKKGHRFVTKSDTEVILHLYQEYGEDCINFMNGQWAFAIWDSRERKLFLSRDRMGIRPLFYTNTGREFLFGSEVKALLAHPRIKAELDGRAVREVFTFWFTMAPKSIVKGISQLPPGCSLTVKDGKATVKCYWSIDFAGHDKEADEDRYADELCDLLQDATRLRLRADVPVAAYISGGLDSSITSALARDMVGGALRSFSVAFEDPALDESYYQKKMAECLGTQHETIRCSSSSIGEIFSDLVWHMETPILRTAPGPMFLLSRLVSERGIKVVLTGEGADEFMGGYDIYKEAKIRAFWAAQVDSRRRPLLLKRLYPYLTDVQKQSPSYLQAFFKIDRKGIKDPFFSHRPRWELTAKAQMLFSAEFRARTAELDPYRALTDSLPEGLSNLDVFCRAQHLESALLLPNYLLSSQGDRVAMAHSVEGRYPFLDYRVAEFAMKLPPRLKMKVLKEKYLLKRALGHLVPETIMKRPKQPYRAPDAASLIDPIAGQVRTDYIGDMLSPERICEYGVFDPDAVGKLVDKAKRGKIISFLDNAALVGVLSTQATVDQFIVNYQERVTDAINRAERQTVCN